MWVFKKCTNNRNYKQDAGVSTNFILSKVNVLGHYRAYDNTSINYLRCQNTYYLNITSN